MTLSRNLLYLSAESLAEGAAAHVHVNEIVAGLRRRDWNVDILMPDYSESEGRTSAVRRLSAIFDLNRRAFRRLGEVDGIYCRANPLLLPIARWAKSQGKVVVHECNGVYTDIAIAHPWTRRFLSVFAAMQRWQYRNADAVVTVSEQLRDWVSGERGRHDVQIISNAANTELFRADVEPLPPVGGPYAAFVGALAPWHGVDVMLRAVELPEWPAGVALVIIGGGADFAKVRAAAERNSLVIALGQQPYLKIPSLIAGARLGLVHVVELPGRSGVGLAPLKMFEMLSVGLPVVATNFPTQREFVEEHRCGIVVPPGDAAALARAVAELIAKPEEARQMGERGRDVVQREHSWDHRAAQADQLLRGLIAT